MKRFGFSVVLVTLGLTVLCTLLLASPLLAEPPERGFGFKGTVSGFPTGEVFVSGRRRLLPRHQFCLLGRRL
jgi:hypothetical protein